MHYEHKFFDWANLQVCITFATLEDYENCVGLVRVQGYNNVTRQDETLFAKNFTSPTERIKAIAKASEICSFPMPLLEECNMVETNIQWEVTDTFGAEGKNRGVEKEANKLSKVSKKTKEHPFFDYEANCRKSAWDTPRHLSEADWQIAQELLSASDTESDFLDYLLRLGSEEMEALFYRVLGHPEAKHYIKSHEWVLQTYYPGFVRHTREKLQQAVLSHQAGI